MPRDPKDISVTAGERTQRRIGELDDTKDPLRIRVGAGPAGSEGKEGKAGENGRSAGLKYKYSTNLEESDPTSGFVKFNNATLTSATRIRLSETDADGNAIAAELALWDDSTSTVRGQIIMRSIANKARLAVFNITGALTDNGTWDQIVITGVVLNGTFSNNEEVTLEFSRTGDKGETGGEGPAGANGKEGPAGSAENNDWKNSVRAATTANIFTIATALNPGDVLDGVTLAENDRVLVKNQTTTKENGIWVVKASPARALDADAAAELSGGSTIYVEEGTRNKRRTFQIITPGNITPGTTSHEYQQLGIRDFGIVEALPTSEAVKGDRCTYIADKTNGVFWELIYDGEGEYPWKKVGGPGLFAETTAENSTASTTYVTEGSPAITAPLKGDYMIEVACRYWNSVASNYGYFSPKIGAAATGDDNGVRDIGGAAVGSGTMRRKRINVSAAATAIQTQIRVGGSTGFFNSRWLTIDPVRVG